MEYKALWQQGTEILTDAGVGEASLDARLLLEAVCGTTGSDLFAHPDREVSPEEEAAFRSDIEKRADRIPLQQILGCQEFMGLSFTVNDQVLIPRQDTEILVEEVLKELTDGTRILDLCTGSGCILLSLLHYSNDCIGTGADLSPAALEVARTNAEQLEIRAEWVHSDLFENIPGRYDVIVSNPPYIASHVIPTLEEEVRLHEPLMALDGDADGLRFYRAIIAGAPAHLMRGGALYFEIGYDQGEAVSTLMKEAGFKEVRVVRDYSGLDRVVTGIYY